MSATTRPALDAATLNNITISVMDLDRAIDWYERVMCFSLTRRGTFPALEASYAFMKRKDYALELIQVPAAHRLPAIDADPPGHLGPTGFKALVLDVDDLSAATAELIAHEVAIVWNQQLLDPETGLTSTLVRDPEGNLINFFQHLP